MVMPRQLDHDHEAHHQPSSLPFCQCPQWSGHSCDGRLGADAVDMEFMPAAWRQRHAEAGNCGRWPANGAERIRVTPACARHMEETDHRWVWRVEPEPSPLAISDAWLYWDGQDAESAGWWLRYRDARSGIERGEPVDGSRDDTFDELAAAAAAALPAREGDIRVRRGGDRDARITLRGDDAPVWRAVWP